MIEKTCDILVLGGGGSGLVAAVRAAELGKRVIVLEKAKKLGGGMLFASTMRTFGSRWQKERGIEDRTAQYMRQAMDATYWRLDPETARNAIEGTGWFFDWLCDLEEGIGDQFREGTYVFDGPQGQVGPQNGGQNNGGGRLVMETMEKHCNLLGVEVLTETPFVDAELDEKGRLSAILAKRGEETIRIGCSAVILASGSWVRDPETVEKVCPAFGQAVMGKSPHTNPNYTGDGLRLAKKLGAALDYDSCCLRLMGPFYQSGSVVLDQAAMSAFAICVNLLGRRFTSEPMVPRMDFFDTGHVLLDQPKSVSFAILDRNAIAAAARRARTSPEPCMPPLRPPVYPDSDEELWADIEQAVEKGTAYRGDTPQELAGQIGVDPEGLARTLADYNDFCKTGMDWDGYKAAEDLVEMTGPFYAVQGFLGTDGAFGGVAINAQMEVLGEAGPVSGLYAAGDLTNGRHIVLGGVKRQILNDMSWAFSSGFQAGTNAAEDLS